MKVLTEVMNREVIIVEVMENLCIVENQVVIAKAAEILEDTEEVAILEVSVVLLKENLKFSSDDESYDSRNYVSSQRRELKSSKFNIDNNGDSDTVIETKDQPIPKRSEESTFWTR